MGVRTDRQQKADFKNLQKAEGAKKRKRLSIKCRCCGTIMSVSRSVAAKGKKYCDWQCRTKHMRGDNGPNTRGGQWMRGENNPNWKDGKGYERQSRENQDKSNQWRRRVFARDHYTCQKCGLKPKEKGRLNAHHIKEWAKYPEHRFDIGNGITLCIPCHKEIHRGGN